MPGVRATATPFQMPFIPRLSNLYDRVMARSGDRRLVNGLEGGGRLDPGPEGRRKLAGGVSHRISEENHAPRRGAGKHRDSDTPPGRPALWTVSGG